MGGSYATCLALKQAQSADRCVRVEILESFFAFFSSSNFEVLGLSRVFAFLKFVVKCIFWILIILPFCFLFAISAFCQTPDLGQGLEFDFTLANNKNKNNKKNKNNPHLNFL